MSTTYSHQPLGHPHRQIRLVKLGHSTADPQDKRLVQCSLSTVDLSNAPDYVALSYACGDPNDLVPVEVDGQQLMVYRNLDEALRRIRTRDIDPLWIDCLSINQSDPAEKSVQVQLMSHIFKNATYVLAWLGEERDGSSLAFDILQGLGQMDFLPLTLEFEGDHNLSNPHEVRQRCVDLRKLLFDRMRYQHEELKSLGDAQIEASTSPSLLEIIGKAALRAIIDLLLRPWFSRLWIRQELLLARRSKFMCGADDCLGTHLLSGALLTLSFGSFSRRQRSPILQVLITASESSRLYDVGSLALKLEVIKIDTDGLSLNVIVRDCQQCLCELGQDKIFALLGIANDDDLVDLNAPDYSMSVLDVYERFIRTTIQLSGSLNVLGYSSQRPAVSSWIPDFSSRTSYNYLTPYDKPQIYHASLDRKAICEIPGPSARSSVQKILKVRGFVLDQIEHVGSEPELEFVQDPNSPMLQQWKSLLHTGTSSEVDEAFWLTLTLDRADGRHRFTKEQRNKFLDQTREWLSRSPQSLWPDGEYRESISRAEGMQFFTSKRKGFMCLGETIIPIQRDDLICVLFGGQTPFLLRPNGEHYTLLGPCYVHGVMDGEAMSMEEADPANQEWFCLV